MDSEGLRDCGWVTLAFFCDDGILTNTDGLWGVSFVFVEYRLGKWCNRGTVSGEFDD